MTVLFKKIKEGDIATFEMVFRQYYTPLCMYAFSITGRKDIAEEVVQDVFYNIWKERERIRIRLSLKNYLFGAVKNHSLNYKEHEEVHQRYQEQILLESHETDLSPHELLEYKELESLISKILNRMPGRRRKIFLLHRMEGKKQKEIADELAISIKTVEAEMTKAYQALRQGIEKYNKRL